MATDKNIKKELQNIAPILAKLKKPQEEPLHKDYFERVQNEAILKIRATSVVTELETAAPLLSKIDKSILNSSNKNFDALQQQVFQKIAPKTSIQKSPSKLDALLDELLGWLTPQTKLAFSILAVGAMLVGIQLANVQSKTQLELSRYMQQFSEQEIQKYLAENIDDIDEVSLIKNTELKTENELFLNSDIQLKSVEEYWLQENDIDYTELDSDLI
jgi:hypothetical protein